MQGESYTMSELNDLSYEEMLNLRERVRQQLWRKKQRSTTLKTEKYRQKNKEEIVVKEKELELIDQVKKQLKLEMKHA